MTLANLNDSVTVTHLDCAAPTDVPFLDDDAIAVGLDLGLQDPPMDTRPCQTTNTPNHGCFRLTFPGRITVEPANLTVVKTPDAGIYQIGQAPSFTIVVTSTGPGTALNVMLADTLPTLGNLTNWTIDPAVTGCSITSGTMLKCSFGNMPKDDTRTVVVRTTAVADVTGCGQLNNTATVSADNVAPKNDAGAQSCADYMVTKTPDGGVYKVGEVASFTIAVKGLAGVAKNVMLTDTLPTLGNLVAWTIDPAVAGCAITSGTMLKCSFGDLAKDATRAVTVKTTVVADATGCGLLDNTATITSDNLPSKSDPGSLSCADYMVTKTPDGGTYQIGQPASFTIEVKGVAGVAKNVMLTDTLPTLGNLTTWTIDPVVTGCAITTGTQLKCAFGDLAAGQTRTVVVKTTAAADVTGCATLDNTATITADNLPSKSDPGSLSCADYMVTKTPDGGMYDVGQVPSFTIAVKGLAGVAKNVMLTDTLPTFGNLTTWTIDPAVTGCAITGGTMLKCSFGDLAKDATRTVTVKTTVAADATGCGTLPNTATITADNLPTKSDPGDLRCADYMVTKTPDGGTYQVGQPASFSIEVKGVAGVAKNVMLTDTLPTLGNLTAWTIDPAVTGCAITTGTQLKCSFGDLAAGQTRTVTVKTTTAADLTGCGSLPNTATITSDNLPTKSDPGSLSCADYMVTKTPDGGAYSVGQVASFTIAVKGLAGVAKNVMLTDTLPTLGNLTTWTIDPAVTGCAITGGTMLKCSFGDLAKDATRAVTVKTTVAADATGCGMLPNTATITSDNLPTKSDPGDLSCANLAITKTPDEGTYQVGQPASFTIEVQVLVGVARNVMLTDTLPTLGNLTTWTVDPAVTGCAVTAGTMLKCNFGDLTAGQTRTVTVKTTTAADTTGCGRLDNLASVTATGIGPLTDPGSLNCADYMLTKTPDGGTYQIGQPASFTIVVKGLTGVVKNVMLTDTLPTLGNLTAWMVDPAVTGCAVTGGTMLKCSFGDLAKDATRTVTVKTTQAADATGCGTLPNVATVTADNAPTKSDPGDLSCADYMVTKTPDGGTYEVGQPARFTIEVKGVVGTARNVMLTDTLPTLGNLTAWTVDPAVTGCAITAGTMLKCSFGNLAAGQTRTVTVRTTTAADPSGCGQLDNTATVTGDNVQTKSDPGSLSCTPKCGQFELPCQITANGKTYATLQAAVNGVPNGTAAAPSVIQVKGKCKGPAVLIKSRSNIVIMGEPPRDAAGNIVAGVTPAPASTTPPPATGCRAKGPGPGDLRSTILPDLTLPFPSGSDGEAIKIESSTNIGVWYLNVVEADPHDGVEYKLTTGGITFCNCVSRNDEGIQLHTGNTHLSQQNLVCENENGIHARHTTKSAKIVDNTVTNNNRVQTGAAPTTPPRHGISLIEGSTLNEVTGNIVTLNGQDGIQLEDAPANKVLNNDVQDNGGNLPPGGTPCGVELVSSNNNCINGNIIADNVGDPAPGKVCEVSGTGNKGTNVASNMTPCP